MFEIFSVVVRMYNQMKAKLAKFYGSRPANVPGRTGDDRYGIFLHHAFVAVLFLNPVQKGVERFKAVRAKKNRTIGLSIRAMKLLS